MEQRKYKVSARQQLRDFKWLKSIRLLCKNGYIVGDEDVWRIQEYFYKNGGNNSEIQKWHNKKILKLNEHRKDLNECIEELEKELKLKNEFIKNLVEE